VTRGRLEATFVLEPGGWDAALNGTVDRVVPAGTYVLTDLADAMASATRTCEATALDPKPPPAKPPVPPLKASLGDLLKSKERKSK